MSIIAWVSARSVIRGQVRSHAAQPGQRFAVAPRLAGLWRIKRCEDRPPIGGLSSRSCVSSQIARQVGSPKVKRWRVASPRLQPTFNLCVYYNTICQKWNHKRAEFSLQFCHRLTATRDFGSRRPSSPSPGRRRVPESCAAKLRNSGTILAGNLTNGMASGILPP